MSAPFEAKWRGRCEDCGHPIKPGDLVQYDDNDLVHVDCDGDGEVSAQPSRPVEVCPRCWLTKPCACEESA